MISAKAIVYKDEKTKKLINIKEEKRPICIQLFGHEPDIIANAAKQVSQYADLIDINMGCPAPKIVKNGEGSKLLLDLDLARRNNFQNS
jgi:tRNA-dihydrouridine synthase B